MDKEYCDAGLEFILEDDPFEPYYSVGCMSFSLRGNIVIPEKLNGIYVRKIRNFGFKLCQNLISIRIPESIYFIGNNAFEGCFSLESISGLENVTNLGERAFALCRSLKSIKLSDDLDEIKKETFLDCESLTSINIPKNIFSIGEGAFMLCKSLKSISLLSNDITFEFIAEKTFFGCESLESVVISKYIWGMDRDAFVGCNSLKFYFIEVKREYVFPNNDDLEGFEFDYYTDFTKVYCYEENSPKEKGNYWHYVDGKPCVW